MKATTKSLHATLATLIVAGIHLGAATGCGASGATVATARAPADSLPDSPRAEQTARAYFASPHGAVAQIHALGGWTTLCNVPCEREVPIGSEYRLLQGDRELAAGVLEARPGERVTVAKRGASAGSVVAIVAGATLVGGGVLAAAPGIWLKAVLGRSELDGYIYGGLVTAAVGGVVLAVGITSLQAPRGIRAEPRSAPIDTREPTWRSVDAIERHAAKLSAVPVLSGRF